MSRKPKKRKNINGMGSVRQLPNKKWEYRFMLGNARRSVTADTGELAVARAREMTVEYMKHPGTKVKASDMTFGIYASRWWALHVTEVRASTLAVDAIVRDHLVDALGLLLMQEIGPTHIHELIKREAACHKGTSFTSKLRGMAYQIFTAAVIEGIVASNPVALIKQKKKTSAAGKIKEKKDAYRPEEAEHIADACLAHPGNRTANIILVLMFSGARESELLALHKEYVEPTGRSFDVLQALNIVEGKFVMGDVKAAASLRHVPVARVARPAMRALRDEAVGERLFPSRIRRVEYTGAQGLRRAYGRFIRGLGLRYLPPHCLRHTYATMLAAAGAPPAVIQAIMGHQDYRTTANIYTHIQFWLTPYARQLLDKWGVTNDPLEMVGETTPKPR